MNIGYFRCLVPRVRGRGGSDEGGQEGVVMMVMATWNERRGRNGVSGMEGMKAKGAG